MSDATTRLRRESFVAYGIALATGIAGGLLTDIGPWYYALKKPSWQPPDWLFGPAWTLIFGLSALAGLIAWRATQNPRRRHRLLQLAGLNVLLNIGWSLLFFKLRRPDHALLEVAFLWLSVLALAAYGGALSRTSGLLLLPYLGWVSFASFLNFTIVQLNAPFAAP
jgi:tryptophan-rich sensory protein